MTKFIQLLFSGMSLGMVYSLIALGFVIVYKGSRVFNFAHGDFVMLAAYIVVAVSATAPYPLAVLTAVAVLIVVAVVVERLVLRRMLGQPLFSIVMVTLGIGIMVRRRRDDLGLPEQGYADPIGPAVWRIGVAFAKTNVATIAVSLALLAALWWFYQRTSTGLALRATASHQEAALAQGIDVRRMFVASWVIAGVLATAGGVFLGGFRGRSGWRWPSSRSTLPAIIIGGFDSLVGAVIGGLTVRVAQVLSAGYLRLRRRPPAGRDAVDRDVRRAAGATARPVRHTRDREGLRWRRHRAQGLLDVVPPGAGAHAACRPTSGAWWWRSCDRLPFSLARRGCRSACSR